MRSLKPAIYAALLTIPLLVNSCQTDTPKDSVPKEQTTDKIQADAPTQPPPPPDIHYHFLKKDSLKAVHKQMDSLQIQIITAINRVDKSHLLRLDSVLIPDTFLKDMSTYSPYPKQLPFLAKVPKLLYFSYAIQAFAAYENGKQILWGPTNMGRKSKPTPTGLFFTNWKSKKIRSTVDDEWILKWNFNIANKAGVGFHEYALPGYPASHSCLRLQEADAMYLYNWADQWILASDGNTLKAQGTPVIVFGSYPFDAKGRPWYTLADDGKSTDISSEILEKETTPFLEKIQEQQQRRDTVIAARQQ